MAAMLSSTRIFSLLKLLAISILSSSMEYISYCRRISTSLNIRVKVDGMIEYSIFSFIMMSMTVSLISSLLNPFARAAWNTGELGSQNKDATNISFEINDYSYSDANWIAMLNALESDSSNWKILFSIIKPP